MSISCDPGDLQLAAKAFKGLSPQQNKWVQTYLLALIAGGSTDPETLAAAAKVFKGVSDGMISRIMAYLLCQIANGGSGGACPQDMQVAWTPTNLKLGEMMGFSSFHTSPGLPGITSLTFTQASMLSEPLDIENCNDLTSISFTNLTTTDSYLYFSGNAALSSFTAPVLAHVDNGASYGIFFQSNNLASLSLPSLVSLTAFQLDTEPVATLSLPLLTTVSVGSFVVIGCNSLTSLSLPSIANVSVGALTINFCSTLASVTINSLVSAVNGLNVSNAPLLTVIGLAAWVPTNGSSNDFSGNGLLAATVNQILHRAVLNAGFVSGSINTSGGTSAAPSGAGIADKVTLTGRGVTVTTN